MFHRFSRHGLRELQGLYAAFEGFRVGRKVGAGELQDVLLSFLAEKPGHGYELIKRIEEYSKGFYSPSPGMIYPALTYLEELGYTTVEVDGTKKLYNVTDAGRAYLTEHQVQVDAILAELRNGGHRLEQLSELFGAGDEEDAAQDHSFVDELRTARHELRRAMHGKWHASAEEAKRIAGILRAAAKEILGGKPTDGDQAGDAPH